VSKVASLCSGVFRRAWVAGHHRRCCKGQIAVQTGWPNACYANMSQTGLGDRNRCTGLAIYSDEGKEQLSSTAAKQRTRTPAASGIVQFHTNVYCWPSNAVHLLAERLLLHPGRV
jgi:hypothetical protein